MDIQTWQNFILRFEYHVELIQIDFIKNFQDKWTILERVNLNSAEKFAELHQVKWTLQLFPCYF